MVSHDFEQPHVQKSTSDLAKGFAVFPHGALHQDLSWEKGLPEGHGQANHKSSILFGGTMIPIIE